MPKWIKSMCLLLIENKNDCPMEKKNVKHFLYLPYLFFKALRIHVLKMTANMTFMLSCGLFMAK